MCMKLFGNQYEKDQYTKWNVDFRNHILNQVRERPVY